ncbi:MAG TPA: hypothetical protein VKE96_21790 [Vicinamibacterales bacterium]|nr:hypothetical protein [Vicinamibacterales bacterium]
MTRRTMLALAAGAVMMVLPACSSNSPAAPTPTGPSQARITVTASAPLLAFSPRAGFAFRITVPATISEDAGVGANINFVRLQQMFRGVEVERSEISSADLVVATGSNRLNANATRNINLIYDVNDGRATSGILTFGFTDDRGTPQSVDFTVSY